MAGLLDFISSPEGQGLLAGAFGYAANARRGAPINSLGRGGLAGLAGYANAQELQKQMAEAEQMKKLRDIQTETGQIQLGELRRKTSDDDAARKILQGVYGSTGIPLSNGIPSSGGPTGAVNSALPPDLQIGALPPTQAYQAAINQQPSIQPTANQNQVVPKVDVFSRYKAIGDQMAAKGLIDQANQYYNLAEKFRPKYNTTPQQMMVNGKLTNVLVSEDGTAKTMDGFDVKPDMVEQDLGSVKQWVNKNAITPGQTFAKTMTPGEVATNKLGWANNSLENLKFNNTVQQQSAPQFHDGMWLTRPSNTNPQGSAVAVPGFIKPLTEFQGKSTNYASRMQDADKVLTELRDKVHPYEVAQAGYRSEFPAWLPGGQILGGAVTSMNQSFNPMVTSEAQRYRQAQENWVTANLRQESGAAIGKDEMAKDIIKWFPQPGDSQEVIKQKEAARKVAQRAMEVQAGPGAQQIRSILRPSAKPEGQWEAPGADPLGLFKR